MKPFNTDSPLAAGSRARAPGNKLKMPSTERQIVRPGALPAPPVNRENEHLSDSKSSKRLPQASSAALLPLAVSPTEAALMARCSRGFLYKPIRSGELRSFKMGRSRKILYGDLVEWVNALADRGLAG